MLSILFLMSCTATGPTYIDRLKEADATCPTMPQWQSGWNKQQRSEVVGIMECRRYAEEDTLLLNHPYLLSTYKECSGILEPIFYGWRDGKISDNNFQTKGGAIYRECARRLGSADSDYQQQINKANSSDNPWGDIVAAFACMNPKMSGTGCARVLAAANGADTCCKICDIGKACGDTCISRLDTCHIGRGCACNKDER